MRLAGGEREGEREREEGKREGGKRGGRGKAGRGPQFPNPCSQSLRGTAGRSGVWDPGQAWLWGRWGRWAQAHRDSRTPQLARPGRTQAEAKINVRRADRGRPVGRLNTHPHLATQRASVHAGPGARVGPTAGPPRPPDLRGKPRRGRPAPSH